MYSEAVLDHFQNPRNAGTLDAATATVSVGFTAVVFTAEASIRGAITHMLIPTPAAITDTVTDLYALIGALSVRIAIARLFLDGG